MTPLLASGEELVRILFSEVDRKAIPPRAVHAVLDGARDPSIHGRVMAVGGGECLFREVTSPKLLAAAPWLVTLDPNEEATLELLEAMWGNAWGVFVESSAPRPSVVRHLRSFLRVQDESAKKLFFRFYDPRVLRRYFPTTNEDEVRTWRGPVARYAMESEDGTAVVFDRPLSGRFERTSVTIRPAAKARAAAAR